ncbi:hypothetical protein [Desulforhopalus sp. IMCC35007]|uniref:hypothetical protein n=1 Tax=Desulforhopalus sp. IMCC35007 TaxID=2569543 RepID=UPI0010AE7C2B|nr:hypothetical protein [Desulforhopalus sp. IMCC35007]TKB08166.1 hypothetical protein FCL48_14395 [Desulforhopalus sp. IMCC35007]
MTRILFVTGEPGEFDTFITGLPQGWDTSLGVVNTAAKAFEIVAAEKVDVVVVGKTAGDQTSLDFVKKLMKHHPLVNCAMVSSLSHDDFHEATEGYGLFMQLTEKPDVDQAHKMVEILNSIMGLMNS